MLRRILLVAGCLALLAVLIDLSLDKIRDTTRASVSPAAALAPRTQSAAPAEGKPSGSRGSVLRTRKREMARFRFALERGVAQARDLDGHVQAAVWVDDWPAPIAVGDDLRRPLRMWSLAKPVEAVAALQFASRKRVQLTAGFTLAMERALRRSENCSARRIVLELEQLAGGPAGARVAFAAVLPARLQGRLGRNATGGVSRRSVRAHRCGPASGRRRSDVSSGCTAADR